MILLGKVVSLKNISINGENFQSRFGEFVMAMEFASTKHFHPL